MYIMRLLLIFLFQPVSIFSINAIEHFIKHRKVQNFTIKIINSKKNTNYNDWIEYKYIFDNENYLKKRLLRVGFPFKREHMFDCYYHENQIDPMGYSWSVIKTIERLLNVSVEIVPIENYTNFSETLSQEVDIIVCHPYIENKSSLSNLTELYPTIISNFLLVYNPHKLHFTKDIFVLTFAGWLWATFFGTLIILGLSLRISTIKYSMIYVNHEPWSWVEITLWAIAAACQQGLSHTPSGFTSCMIFFLGYLLAYLLYTGFAAAITSILVQHDINSGSDFSRIESNKLSLVTLESSSYFIQTLKRQFLTTKYVRDLDILFEHLSYDDTIGVAPQIYINQYMANKLSYEQATNYITAKLDKKYIKGFLVFKTSLWRNSISTALDQFGLLQNMLKRNLQSMQFTKLNTGYSSAGQEHVGSANLLFITGAVISIVFLLAEITLYIYKKSRKNIGL